MDQLQWRAFGEVAAKFAKIRISKTTAIQNKRTFKAILDGIVTV